MSHQEDARLGTVRRQQLVEELKVRLYLRRQGHGRDGGERTVAADERGQSQVRMSEDGYGRRLGSVGLVMDCVQKRHIEIE